MKLSLCMIVRDNQEILPACLRGIRRWVDEMIVVDTGSVDGTPEIARSFGARLFHFPWCDDFAAARNESLRHASGEWLFWMDSDDTIDEANGRLLREVVERPHDGRTLGYVAQVHCPSANGDGETVVDHVKILRNHPELRFEFRIHEQVLPAIRRLGGEVGWTDVFVTHSGSDQSEAGRQRKYERDLRILELELADRGEHPFVLFNLGMTYADMERHSTAADYLRRCLAVSSPDESHLRKAYAILVGSLSRVEPGEALEVCRRGLEIYPGDRELVFRLGILCHDRGWFDEAIDAYRAALDTVEQRRFSSVDPGIHGYKARHNLAVTYRDAGRLDLAESHWRQVVTERPSFHAARAALVRVLIQQRRFVTAAIELESVKLPLLEAELAEAKGELDVARRLIEAACDESPTDPDPLEALSRFLFEQAEPSEAERAIRRLLAIREDGAAYHNLGLVLVRQKRLAEAARALRASLEYRPDAPHTQQELAKVEGSL